MLGQNQPGPEEFALRDLVVECLQQQQSFGRLASHEHPLGSRLLVDSAWVEAFGAVKAPKAPWQYVTLDACQWGSCSPDCRDDSRPVKKGLTLMANFDLRPLGLRCSNRRALPSAPEAPEEAEAVDALEARPGPQLCPAAHREQPVFALRGGFAEAQDAEAQEQPFAPEPLEKRDQLRKDLEKDVEVAHSRSEARGREAAGARSCSPWTSTVASPRTPGPTRRTARAWSATSSSATLPSTLA